MPDSSVPLWPQLALQKDLPGNWGWERFRPMSVLWLQSRKTVAPNTAIATITTATTASRCLSYSCHCHFSCCYYYANPSCSRPRRPNTIINDDLVSVCMNCTSGRIVFAALLVILVAYSAYATFVALVGGTETLLPRLLLLVMYCSSEARVWGGLAVCLGLFRV